MRRAAQKLCLRKGNLVFVQISEENEIFSRVAGEGPEEGGKRQVRHGVVHRRPHAHQV